MWIFCFGLGRENYGTQMNTDFLFWGCVLFRIYVFINVGLVCLLMFGRVVCPDVAFDRLKESGIIEELTNHSNRNIISSLLVKSFDGLPEPEEIVEENALRNSISEKDERDNDLLKFWEDYLDSNGCGDSDLLFHDNPVVLPYLTLGDKVFDYVEKGFPNRRDLEKAVTSFCLGERRLFWNNDEWVWRNDGVKNVITRDMHGDMYACQFDCSGKYKKINGLFGEIEEFDTMNVVSSIGIGAYQDWSEFLVSLLRFSEKIGMREIPEIVNWEETLESIGGGRGGAYTVGGSSEWSVGLLMKSQLICKGENLKFFPISICPGPQRDSYMPYYEDGSLTYIIKSSEGENLGRKEPAFEGVKFDRRISYNAEDLPEALKATYKYFARDRSLIPMIMDRFNEEGK